MPIGQTLAAVRQVLKGHLGVVVDYGVGSADDMLYNSLISSKQIWLAAEYDWPQLEDEWRVDVVVGQRFVDFPSTGTKSGLNGAVDVTRGVKLSVKYSGNWQEVEYGVGDDEYNTLDPDIPDLMDPVMKWQRLGPMRFEIWPLPASPQAIKFEARRVPAMLIADTDIVSLDSELVALMVAAERLAKAESPDAGLKNAAAQRLLTNLRAAVPTKDKSIRLGFHNEANIRRSNRRLVPIAIAKQG